MAYVGRFAPSPTGPLHAGSLLTAVASFLHARQADGEWLVRIEDIDPPREVPGAADEILRALEALDLTWDRSVLYQRQRLDVYADAVRRLVDQGLAFACRCSRSTIRAQTAEPGARVGYPGTCRELGLPADDAAVRMRVDAPWDSFEDGLQGRYDAPRSAGYEDYVIRRRDGLPAYHLAVVIDDAFQGVTTIVRGHDLLECVPAQRHLQAALGLPHPRYYHVPVLVGPTGQKLSKQTGARAIDTRDPSREAFAALERLGATPPAELEGARPAELWAWAIEHWDIERLRGVAAIPIGD
ncbi:MAG: tRNA glutamyl-Q(34) synthetase GluQRS [Gammaproteobacteria bacterium]|nr:tRNA glutamyl-Q(34) synthetase GluQRS [Gammaproteobacteria bacterium]